MSERKGGAGRGCVVVASYIYKYREVRELELDPFFAARFSLTTLLFCIVILLKHTQHNPLQPSQANQTMNRRWGGWRCLGLESMRNRNRKKEREKGGGGSDGRAQGHGSGMACPWVFSSVFIPPCWSGHFFNTERESIYPYSCVLIKREQDSISTPALHTLVWRLTWKKRKSVGTTGGNMAGTEPRHENKNTTKETKHEKQTNQPIHGMYKGVRLLSSFRWGLSGLKLCTCFWG